MNCQAYQSKILSESLPTEDEFEAEFDRITGGANAQVSKPIPNVHYNTRDMRDYRHRRFADVEDFIYRQCSKEAFRLAA